MTKAILMLTRKSFNLLKISFRLGGQPCTTLNLQPRRRRRRTLLVNPLWASSGATVHARQVRPPATWALRSMVWLRIPASAWGDSQPGGRNQRNLGIGIGIGIDQCDFRRRAPATVDIEGLRAALHQVLLRCRQLGQQHETGSTVAPTPTWCRAQHLRHRHGTQQRLVVPGLELVGADNPCAASCARPAAVGGCCRPATIRTLRLIPDVGATRETSAQASASSSARDRSVGPGRRCGRRCGRRP